MHKQNLIGLVILILTLACTIAPAPTPTATPLPTSTPIPPTTMPVQPSQPPATTPEPPDTGWQPYGPGIEWRSLPLSLTLGTERIIMVRIEPQSLRPRVLYTPDHPRKISEWAGQSGARMVINAGYFTEENLATGLLVNDGNYHGVSYEDYAGMLTVPTAGKPEVRWLRARPFNPNEKLDQGVQCFPVLVKPGGVMGFPEDADEGQNARRTVVAQDRQGRLIFMVARRGLFSLHELAVWLTENDLEVDIALNLDGGPSTGLWLLNEPAAQIDSGGEIPAVIIIE